ncbi:MAG: L,D-transpeptidase family protein [Hyphomicrobiales bacterium]
MTFLTAGKRNWRSVLTALAVAAPLMAQPLAVLPAHAGNNGFSLFKNFGKGKGNQGATTTNFAANHGGEYASNGSKVSTVTEVVWDRNIQPMLTPGAGEALRAAEDHYRNAISQGGFPKIGRTALKKGSTGKPVIALNRRLNMEGYLRDEATQGEYASIFTTATEDALRRFQTNMGLAVTGKTDGPTIDALNVPAETRLRTIEANIARMDVYSQNLGDRYVIVNIPAQQIQTVQGARVYSQHNAIVGRISRPSPVVMTSLSDINFNPYWNAPVSIVEKDIIPKILNGTNVITDMNIKVFKGYGGPEIDPSTVDWRSATPDDYYFRQEPGPENAMATAKINFPSPFGIYMHDTPEKQLFKNSPRFFSSGCVRVENMSLMVQWVLNGQDGIGADQIATLAETLERKDVKLIDPPQLRVVYMTAWPTAGGTVAFRNDVYELDGTGFTVGQPMPAGETSPDGQRFVLKPLPRLVAEVDDGGSAGGLFNWGKKSTVKTIDGKPITGKPVAGTQDNTAKRSSFFGDGGTTPATGNKTVQKAAPKPLFGVSAAKTATASKTKAKTNKDAPGLFDWAAYRKEQAVGSKATKAKKPVKKTAAADAKNAVVTKDKKTADAGKAATSGKDAKVASAKVDTSKTKADKAAPVKDAKAAPAKDAKTAVASTAGDAPKAKDAAAKTAKPAAGCLAGKDGKLPAGCKTAAN